MSSITSLIRLRRAGNEPGVMSLSVYSFSGASGEDADDRPRAESRESSSKETVDLQFICFVDRHN